MKKLSLALAIILSLSSFSGIATAASENLIFTFDINGEIVKENDGRLLAEGIPKNTETAMGFLIANPQKKNVTSLRAKIKYDPQKIRITDLDSEDSDFALSPPGENNVNEDEGTITIGRALAGPAQNSAEFFVSIISFELLADEAELSFLNYQSTELGDTAILLTEGIDSNNQLDAAPKKLVIRSANAGSGNNGGGAVTPDPAPTPDNGGSTPGNVFNGGGAVTPDPASTQNTDLPRPQNVKIKTSTDGAVEIVWPLQGDDRITGYYLYYADKSGFYLRRKDLGNTNFARINDFEIGKKYYFAVTAYDANDNESDYSDEVSAIIGQPGSESHRFLGDPRNSGATTNSNTVPSDMFDDVSSTAETGPGHTIAFFIMSLGLAAIGFGARRARFA